MKIESAKILTLPSNNGTIEGGATSTLFGKEANSEIFAKALTGHIGLLNDVKVPVDLSGQLPSLAAESKGNLPGLDTTFGTYSPLIYIQNTPATQLNMETDFTASLLALNDPSALIPNPVADKIKAAQNMNLALAGALPSTTPMPSRVFDKTATAQNISTALLTEEASAKPQTEELMVSKPVDTVVQGDFLPKEISLSSASSPNDPIPTLHDLKNLAATTIAPMTKNPAAIVGSDAVVPETETATILEKKTPAQIPPSLTHPAPIKLPNAAPAEQEMATTTLLCGTAFVNTSPGKAGLTSNNAVPKQAIPSPLASNAPKLNLPNMENLAVPGEPPIAKNQAPVVKPEKTANFEETVPNPAFPLTTIVPTVSPDATSAEQELAATTVSIGSTPVNRQPENAALGSSVGNAAAPKEPVPSPLGSNEPKLILPDLADLAATAPPPTPKNHPPVVEPKAAAPLEETVPTSVAPLATPAPTLPPNGVSTDKKVAEPTVLNDAAFVDKGFKKATLEWPIDNASPDSFLPKEAVPTPGPSDQNMPGLVLPSLESLATTEKASLSKNQAPLIAPAEIPLFEEIVPSQLLPLTASTPILSPNTAPAEQKMTDTSLLNEAVTVNTPLGKATVDGTVDNTSPNTSLPKEAILSQPSQQLAGANLPVLENLAPFKKTLMAENTSPVLEPEKMLAGVPADMGPIHRLIDTKADMSTLSKPLTHPDWGNDLGEQIIWMNNKALPAAELKLNPLHLGPLSVRIDINQDQASIMIATAHAEVKEAIEASIPKLREMLSSQHLNLVNVNISQNSTPEQGRPHPQAFAQKSETTAQGVVDGLAGTTEHPEHGQVTVSNGLLNLYA